MKICAFVFENSFSAMSYLIATPIMQAMIIRIMTKSATENFTRFVPLIVRRSFRFSFPRLRERPRHTFRFP